MSSSNLSTVFGQAVTFTATVIVTAPGSGTASGTVTFLANGTIIGTSVLNGSGVAMLSASGLSASIYTITAQYGGSSNYSSSISGSLTQNVSAGKEDCGL